jgi:hypothetical protein
MTKFCFPIGAKILLGPIRQGKKTKKLGGLGHIG